MSKKRHLSALLTFIREHKPYLLLLLVTFYLYFVFVFITVLKMKPDGLYAGFDNVWSDWSLHIGMANLFAFKEPSDWFAYHPYYAGGQFTYGFLTNFISGMLMRAGFSLYAAFVIPSLLYAFVLVFGLYALYWQVLESKKQAFLATSLVFLSSGPGFLLFISDVLKTKSLNLLFPLATNYSRIEEYQWYAGNFINGMFVPQRAFLLGIAISLIVLNIIFFVLKKTSSAKEAPKYTSLLVTAGILAGILPITHMHSFIAVVAITGLLSVVSYKRWRQLAFFVIPAGLISVFLYFTFISGGIENPEFMKWLPGWAPAQTLANWLKMWLRLWGSMLPLAFIGFAFIKERSLQVKAFFVGLVLLFVLGNLVLMQPIHWDNSKLFLWSYIGFAGLFTITMAKLWRKKVLGKILGALLIASVTLTGVLELYRMMLTDTNNLLMTSTEEIALGVTIRNNTEPTARFLTDSAHNHWVMMWANRPIMLGYTAWAYNFGFLYQQRERDIIKMFQGSSDALELLEKYDVSYVVIGPSELRGQKANEAFYKARFPVAFSDKNHRVYDVRTATSSGDRE